MTRGGNFISNLPRENRTVSRLCLVELKRKSAGNNSLCLFQTCDHQFAQLCAARFTKVVLTTAVGLSENFPAGNHLLRAMWGHDATYYKIKTQKGSKIRTGVTISS